MAVAPAAVNRLPLPPSPAPCTCEADMPAVKEVALPRISTEEKSVKPSPAPASTSTAPALQERFTQTADRQTLLTAARRLLGHVSPFTGDLVVKVVAVDEGVELKVKPTKDADGLSGGKSETGIPVSDAHLLARIKQLTSHLLSPDEQKLLRDLADNEPCSASSVADRCKPVLGKSSFWVVWGQLQHRRLIDQGDDERYRLAADWVRTLLAEK